MAFRIHHVDSHLYLIGLDPPINGFSDFIGAWLVKAPDATYLVDVGPAVTAKQLLDALSALDVDHLDYICLTHIHLDHAGAVGHVARHFAGTPVVCHPKGLPHLVDPQRLWQGTVNTLGDTGRAYGRIQPVDADQLATAGDLVSAPFSLIDTPGHSPHHLAIAAKDCLFVGEACGVSLLLPGGDIYLRPATPPRFFLETSLASVDRLIAAGHDTICYGHVGMQANGMEMLSQHREQLLLWEAILAAEAAVPGEAPMDERRWAERLLVEDPLLKGFERLPASVQTRERYFLANSVKGFVGYLADRPTDTDSP